MEMGSDFAHRVPRRGSAWKSGAANAWSIMAVDPERHLVFVPTGSASPDYFGGLRPGDNKWANSVVALRATTGELVWGFQLVHHDLWDYDTAPPPLLATLTRDAGQVPVVIQGNKTGFIYILNRETGEPTSPIQERPVPPSDVPGETASPTQPFPLTLPALTPQRLSADQAWGPTPADREACRTAISQLRNEGIFTPPSVRGSLLYPGNTGGLTWSGYAFDPDRSLLIVNTNNLPTRARLLPREEFDDPQRRREDGEYGPKLAHRMECSGNSWFPRLDSRAARRRGDNSWRWTSIQNQSAGRCHLARCRDSAARPRRYRPVRSTSADRS